LDDGKDGKYCHSNFLSMTGFVWSNFMATGVNWGKMQWATFDGPFPKTPL